MSSNKVFSNKVFSNGATNSRGATLVELVISIALLAIAIVPLSMMLSYASSHSADTMIDLKVTELGEAYLEEILSKRFDENTGQGGTPACAPSTTACGSIGFEVGESRATFDDVDDYHGLSDQPPVDSLGNPRPGYLRFRVDVQVAYADVAEVTAYGLNSATDAKRIIVTVAPPVGQSVQFDAYRGNF